VTGKRLLKEGQAARTGTVEYPGMDKPLLAGGFLHQPHQVHPRLSASSDRRISNTGRARQTGSGCMLSTQRRVTVRWAGQHDAAWTSCTCAKAQQDRHDVTGTPCDRYGVCRLRRCLWYRRARGVLSSDHGSSCSRKLKPHLLIISSSNEARGLLSVPYCLRVVSIVPACSPGGLPWAMRFVPS
jgi:hypothetical protein